MTDIYNLSFDELQANFTRQGLASYVATQVFSWLYKKHVEELEAMSDLSKEARSFLKSAFYCKKPTCAKKQVSRDGTIKYLLQLDDKAFIETVLIPETERLTQCLSTQVGCKFKCSFCASGALGFKRNLESSEIVGQYLWAVEQGKIPTNLVFMGMGEPLDNFDNVVKAIKILSDPRGAGFTKRRISISTAGITPAIKKLLQLDLGIKLSISLHSLDEEIRSRLMPINKKYPLSELIMVLKTESRNQRHPITFEYALIAGLNTRQKDIALLSRSLHGIRYKINLIPLNQTQGPYKSPAQKEIENFTAGLKKKGIIFTLRKSRGQDIAAACGQLRAAMSENR